MSTETHEEAKSPEISNIVELGETIGKKNKELIDNLVDEFIDRSRKDIKKWRIAMKDLENPKFPNRSKYHDLNADLMIDLHLTSQIQIRELSTLCKRYRIMNQKTGEENIDRTREIRTKWFRTIMKEFLHTKIDGTAVMESKINGKLITGFNHIPKRNIIPERQEMTKRSGFHKGIPYRNNPDYADHLIIELGEARDPGIMIKLAPQVIWKRNAQQAWADFGQIFGLPFRKGTTNSKDKGTLDKIEYMLKKMGTAGYGVFPDGTNIEFIADGQRDAYQVFDAQIERCNSEISKAINSVTMLSDDGSSRSQSEVHFKVNDKIVQSDSEDFESFVNDTLIPYHLIPIGYTFGVDDVFEFDDTESLGKKDQWSIVEGILREYDVDPQYIEKTFGIPILGKKETNSNPFNPAPGDPANRVHNFFVPDYKVSCCAPAIINQANSEEYNRLMKSIAKEVFDQENKSAIPQAMYFERAKQLLNAFSTGFKDRINADWNSPDNYKIALFQANIFRFSAAGTWTDAKAINEFRREASNYDEFEQLVQKYTDLKLPHLNTEYNTAEAVAQNGANWLRQQEEKDDYDLMYQTAGDSNVRSSHRRLEGFVAPVDDPVWDDIYTPNGHNCRCEIIQVAKGSRTYSDRAIIPEDAVQKGFEGNRGKLNTIWKANQSYLKEFPEIEKYNRRTFGLERFTDTFKGRRNFEVRIQDHNEFTRLLKEEADRFDGSSAYYKDWLGRHFEVSVDRFKNHFTKEDKEERWSMLPIVKEVLLTPDEVWMTEQSKKNNRFKTVYIKAFKNKSLHVLTDSEEEGKLKVVTWYVNDLDENMIENDRTGIVLKTK